MPTLPLRWWSESSDLRGESACGATQRQLSSAAALTINIYCEQPYCSLDGNRLALLRKTNPDPDCLFDLLVYDIQTYRFARLANNVVGVANSAWSGILFVTTREAGRQQRWRFDINTLEGEELPPGDEYAASLHSVSADSRWGITHRYLGDQKFALLRVDLAEGRSETIHEGPFLCNPHLQWSFGDPRRLLVQENRGCLMDEIGNIISYGDERGAGLYSLAAEGGDRRDYPLGPPLTPSTTGHEAWIGATEKVLVSLSAPWSDGTRCGTIVEVSPEEPRARVVFEAPDVWTHICVSRCGRYFVTDCYVPEEAPLLVGSIRTGRTAILCDSLTSGGGGQYTHAHPYLTSDNSHVVFNSDRTGLAQTYIAKVPEGLLESLE